MMTTPLITKQYEDTKIDVRVVLSALWIAMLIVFAYVDIFGFLRADVIDAARDGRVAATGLRSTRSSWSSRPSTSSSRH